MSALIQFTVLMMMTFTVKLKNPKVQFDDESRVGNKHVVRTGCEHLDRVLAFYDEIEQIKRVFGKF